MSKTPEPTSAEHGALPLKKRRIGTWIKVVTALSVLFVLACFLLPDIRRAYIVGRISLSNQRLKHLGLALENYSKQQLPVGTVPNARLTPEQRLSWLVTALPFLDQSALYHNIQQEKSWYDPANVPYTKLAIPTLLNPAHSNLILPDGFGVTNYVGVAGVGEDAATLPTFHKRAGAFGYDREVSLRQITDGLSQTMIIMEASPDFGPWAQGGAATVRPVTTKNYLKGRHQRHSQILLGDGSVRGINQKIELSVLEALATINGGESPRDF